MREKKKEKITKTEEEKSQLLRALFHFFICGSQLAMSELALEDMEKGRSYFVNLSIIMHRLRPIIMFPNLLASP